MNQDTNLKWYYPQSLEEIPDLIAKPGVAPHGGGTSLLRGNLSRINGLIDLSALPLRFVEHGEGEIRIGASASYAEVAGLIRQFDPDHILERWVGVFGKLFTWFGAAAAVAILAMGLFSLAGREQELFDSSSGVLSHENLPWLYVCFVVIKLLHEFGHGFACKRFGRVNGSGGEVHEMGIMLLVFTPVPYVDASSSWAFRSKWQRAAVGAAGMLVEFTVAGAAATVWANTSEGTLAMMGIS